MSASQPLPPDAAGAVGGGGDKAGAAGAGGGEAVAPGTKADEGKGEGGAGKSTAVEKDPELSFFEKLALKAAKITGSVPIEAVFQEKVRCNCYSFWCM